MPEDERVSVDEERAKMLENSSTRFLAGWKVGP